MSREIELLERIIAAWEDDRYELIDALYPLIDDARKLLESKEQDQAKQDEEPVAWTCQDELNALGTDVTCYMYAEPLVGETNIPLYLHPAPCPEFVRLSEEEVSEILSSAHTPYEAVCAAENRLERKNK